MSYYSPTIERLIENFEKLPSIGHKTATRLAFHMLNLSEDFLNRMKLLLGKDYNAFFASLQNEEQKSIYVNTNKTSVENFKKFVDFSIEQIPYEQNGFYVDNEKRGRHPLHHAGAFYVQEPSAMFTVNSYRHLSFLGITRRKPFVNKGSSFTCNATSLYPRFPTSIVKTS